MYIFDFDMNGKRFLNNPVRNADDMCIALCIHAARMCHTLSYCGAIMSSSVTTKQQCKLETLACLKSGK